jgi:ABC-type histidine transport system ATPase subunit
LRNDGRLRLEEDGETKRFGTARALVIEPEVFCLDGPTAALAKKLLILLNKSSLA